MRPSISQATKTLAPSAPSVPPPFPLLILSGAISSQKHHFPSRSARPPLDERRIRLPQSSPDIHTSEAFTHYISHMHNTSRPAAREQRGLTWNEIMMRARRRLYAVSDSTARFKTSFPEQGPGGEMESGTVGRFWELP